MQIGLLLNNPSPHQVDFLNALSLRKDIQVFVGYVHPDNPMRSWGSPKPNLPWSHLPAKWINILDGSLYRWLHSRQPHCWVLSSVYTSPITHFIAWCLKRVGTTYIFMGEPPRPHHGLKGRLQTLLLSNILKNATGVLATGSEAAKRYKRIVKNRIPVTSIPYYVDLSEVKKTRPMEVLNTNKPVIFVTSAQLIHRKGLDVLIEACDQLPEGGWQLKIYGTGPLESQLKTQAKKITGAIIFPGTIPYDSRYQVFEEADVFVFPTRWDGWGMVIPEAVSHGLPIITTNQVMSAYDFVSHGENGFIGPAENAEFLANSMKKYIEDRTLLMNNSQRSLHAMQDYTPKIGADRFVSFIEAL
jgi:glycosyltransferase involved in cell wall biosynthesis